MSVAADGVKLGTDAANVGGGFFFAGTIILAGEG